MPEFSPDQLSRWTGGTWQGAAQAVSGIGHDTRRIEPGMLYVAIEGDRFDGHAFLAEAAAAGAAAALVHKEVDSPVPQLRVADTRQALFDLARGYREELDTVVVGITGSVGKTSVKELLAAVLEARGAVGRTPGNWNNDIGLPLSVLGLPREAPHAVLELGMSHPGELEPLCRTARPRHAIITPIGAAHVAQFDSVQDIAAEKATLLRALSPDGIAVLSADCPFYDFFRGQTAARVVSVSMREDAVYHGTPSWHNPVQLDVYEAESGIRFDYRMPAPGAFFMDNALRVIALARELGLQPGEIMRGLLRYRAPGMRWQVETAGGLQVINDAYNANPLSMQAALDTFVRWPVRGRKWLVLGGMHELGEAERSEHEALGRRAAELPVAGCITVGSMGRMIAEGFATAGGAERCEAVEDPAAAVALLRERAAAGDAVLLKASRGEALERCLELLRERSA